MKDLVRRVVAEGIAWAGGQTELAAAIEPLVGTLYSSQNVSAWKTGRANPYGHVLLAIAKVAGISLDELVLEVSLTTQLSQVAEEGRQFREEIRREVGELERSLRELRLRLVGDGPGGGAPR